MIHTLVDVFFFPQDLKDAYFLPFFIKRNFSTSVFLGFLCLSFLSFDSYHTVSLSVQGAEKPVCAHVCLSGVTHVFVSFTISIAEIRPKNHLFLSITFF